MLGGTAGRPGGVGSICRGLEERMKAFERKQEAS